MVSTHPIGVKGEGCSQSGNAGTGVGGAAGGKTCPTSDDNGVPAPLPKTETPSTATV